MEKDSNIYLVSACLLGNNCKYDGDNNYNEEVVKFLEGKIYYSFCPEVEGGMYVPRIPCEIYKGKVINKNGEDKTKEFESGANKALKLIKDKGITKAILKERSPSCGNKQIYDGTFTKTIIEGDGITAKLLKRNGIEVISY
ncbi:MAG: DUF523 domain-containing protein [Erysipelotrichaceae bacterium]